MTGTEIAELLKAHARQSEGLRLKPYLCPAGKLTIGYGRNIEDNGISVEEAEAMLDADVKASLAGVRKSFPWFDTLNDARRLVIADMAFNMGMPRLLGFKKMIGALEVRDYARAAAEMKDSRWYRQVGTRAEKLVRMMETGEL